MNALCDVLERRAPAAWELFRKSAASVETAVTAKERREASRREEGWAARWWHPGPGFAAASTPSELESAIAAVAQARVAPIDPPRLPAGTSPILPEPALPGPPPELFDELGRLLAAESHGEAFVEELAVRRGTSVERIRNAAGLDVSQTSSWLDGFVAATGRSGNLACESRVPFRWDGEPDLPGLARRLSDRLTLPLTGRATPVDRGEWLLEPSVAASLLAGLVPLFTGEADAGWARRPDVFSPGVTIVDDAAADAPFDGEGTPSRRVLLVEDGALRGRLHDLQSAGRAGEPPNGHGVRPSYRVPPARGPRRLFLTVGAPALPLDLLRSVRRGLFASALTAPVRCDLEHDRFEVEFTGVAVVAGRATGRVAGARARGRLSDVLRRIGGAGSDLRFFPAPYPAGAPTLLIERASFE